MLKGFVYVLSNEAMPGLLKVGKTGREVDRRADELYQTGVPLPFKIEHQVLSPDCHALELAVHNQIAGTRVNAAREFFRSDLSATIGLIDDLHREQIEALIGEYLPDQIISPSEYIVDQIHISMLASSLGRHSAEIVQALGDVTPDEIQPAMFRRDEKVRIRRKAWEAKSAK